MSITFFAPNAPEVTTKHYSYKFEENDPIEVRYWEQELSAFPNYTFKDDLILAGANPFL